MIYKISDKEFEKCEKFADAQIIGSGSLYMSRGEDKLQKMKDDIIAGKMGEIAVFRYLKSLGVDTSGPDFNVYEARSKSYDADLQTANFKIHVKTQTRQSQTRYGNSWIVQKNDPIVALGTQKDVFAFCSVDGDTVELLGFVTAFNMRAYGLYEECNVPRYRMTKKAIYWSSVIDALPEKELWKKVW